ncbi:ATP-binding cassette domain-containing protein [Streptomyces sp. NPDC048416]|uniref:ATP-binding cassette domain-containing protein n=1 Tax=Streptomyces sp. NPDC048416 TaxID=3365546 RepID=UPI0037202FD7
MGRRYSIGGPWVLRGVDLDLPSGALVRIEGANGTGKSTLLRLLAGIDAPTEGRVTGRPRTAYVPERFPVALPFTAAGYLTHLGRVHGLPRRTAKERAGRWLERFGAAAYAATPLAELSKGTSQKVAVAQALLADPELLVLDEAWTGLDGAARAELERAVHERVAAGGTVVFVDHDPRRLASREDARYAVADAQLRPARLGSGASAGRAPLGFGASAGPGSLGFGASAGRGPLGFGASGGSVPLAADASADCEALASGASADPVPLASRARPGPLPPTPVGVQPRRVVVLIDIVGAGPPPAQLPGAPEELTEADGDTRSLRVPAEHSDDLLRALLAARPPWHIQGVRST